MLGIQIDGEFLDLPPDTNMELEAENPFLQFADDNLIGEYSLPFQVIANSKNNRLLGYAGVGQTRTDNSATPATLYDNSLQVGTGSVKKEKLNVHLNKVAKGTLNCYYLSKASGFWQDIKDLRLRDIDVGGNRTFAGGTILQDINTTAFGAHVLAVMNGAVGAYDYAFYPVQNSSWGTDPGQYFEPPVMNEISYSGSAIVLEVSPIVPFPYLKYVLLAAIEHTGWTIEGDILDDADFEKITMINFKGIDWGYYKKIVLVGYIRMRSSITFNLQDHLPDMSIAEFLVALKNRFGWWYDFNNAAKKITIRKLSDLPTTAAEDMTQYSSPLITKNISQDNNTYALVNNFITGGGQGIDITKTDYQGEVDKTSDLPSPVEALTSQVYLVIEENNYYSCQQSEGDDTVWEWQIIGANIYDYKPDGYTKEITSKATTVEMVRYSDYLDLIPRVDATGLWNGENGEPEWGIHLAFFFGLRDNKSNDPVPFASHHIYDSQGYTLAAWSLAYKALKTDNTEVGLYDMNWKDFLDLLNSPEEVEHTLYLPLHKYLQLDFADRIIVDGIELFLKQIKASVPYRGVVNCVSVRV